MNTKNATIVDKNGNKIAFVLTLEQNDGAFIPYGHEMKDGETLIYDGVEKAVLMAKPHWNGMDWKEMATPEESESYRVVKMSSLI